MTIREILQKHRSQFISLVDLLSATAEAAGLDFDAASNAFWRTRILDKAKHWKQCKTSGDLTESDGELNRYQLALYEAPPPYKKLSEAQSEEFDKFHHGFLTSEIKAVMTDCGIETPPCLEEGAAPYVWIDPHLRPFYDRIATLKGEVERLKKELEQKMSCSTTDSHSSSDAPPSSSPALPYDHDTRLLRLLPQVIAAAMSQQKWPRQKVFVPELRRLYGLSEAEAKALDAMTRPDRLRKKTSFP